MYHKLWATRRNEKTDCAKRRGQQLEAFCILTSSRQPVTKQSKSLEETNKQMSATVGHSGDLKEGVQTLIQKFPSLGGDTCFTDSGRESCGFKVPAAAAQCGLRASFESSSPCGTHDSCDTDGTGATETHASTTPFWGDLGDWNWIFAAGRLHVSDFTIQRTSRKSSHPWWCMRIWNGIRVDWPTIRERVQENEDFRWNDVLVEVENPEI